MTKELSTVFDKVPFCYRNIHGSERELDGQRRQRMHSVADDDAAARILGRGISASQASAEQLRHCQIPLRP